MNDKDKEEFTQKRYWEGDVCIIDLNEVCAINRISCTGCYYVYRVTFKNGASSDFTGNNLIKQFQEFNKIGGDRNE